MFTTMINFVTWQSITTLVAIKCQAKSCENTIVRIYVYTYVTRVTGFLMNLDGTIINMYIAIIIASRKFSRTIY